jgi:molecular chaperone GrpE (heat shock protein)
MEPTEPGQVPTTPTEPTPPPTTPTPTPEPKTFDEDYVKGLRSEAAKYRKAAKENEARLAELQTAQEAAEAAKLAEQGEFKTLAERAKEEAETLRQELEAERATLAAERLTRQASTIAATLGVIDPNDANVTAAINGLDPSADDLADQIKQRLEALKEVRPYLFQANRAASLARFDPSGQPQGPARETDEERRARLHGGNTAFFNFEDQEAMRAAGGGVIWPKRGQPD